jgi:hypothetical protein
MIYKLISLILCSAIILSVCGCSQSYSNNITNTHVFTSDEPTHLPWEEYLGYFYTLDIVRAQKEIPFSIIIPTYIPDKREITLYPNIKGPLSTIQNNNQVTIEILYNIDYGDDNPSMIHIFEMNFPVLPADPEVDPRYSNIDISGKNIIWTEGISSGDTVFYFHFNHENIYYEVGLYALPYDEAIKIVESMINQLK